MTIMQICFIVMNFYDSSQTSHKGALERQHPVLENPEFIVTPETSKTLGTKSDPLCILNNIPPLRLTQRRNIRGKFS